MCCGPDESRKLFKIRQDVACIEITGDTEVEMITNWCLASLGFLCLLFMTLPHPEYYHCDY